MRRSSLAREHGGSAREAAPSTPYARACSLVLMRAQRNGLAGSRGCGPEPRFKPAFTSPFSQYRSTCNRWQAPASGIVMRARTAVRMTRAVGHVAHLCGFAQRAAHTAARRCAPAHAPTSTQTQALSL
eukprot:6193321-Pleurochrysis_carterae.AAC.2